MYRALAHAVYKRGETTIGGVELPPWGWGVLFLDFLVFLPLILVIGYTFNNVFPILAIIEDPSPPAYEPVSLNESSHVLPEDATPHADESTLGHQTRATTTSFRATYRTLYAIAGWKSLFRGYGIWLIASFTTLFLYSIFTAAILPSLIAAPIAAIAMAPVWTAWVHAVISTPSSKTMSQRMLPFKKIFRAVALPLVLYFFAAEVSGVIPLLVSQALGLNRVHSLDEADPNDIWKALIVISLGLLLKVFLAIPAHVVLIRVQASLLPEDDETIVSFDRTFQNKLEPAIVGGLGYITPMDAWSTFSRASWIRLIKLYVKIFFVGFCAWLLWFAVVIPELAIIIGVTNKGAE